MRLATTLTIGDQTSRFESSPETLGTNLFLSLTCGNVGKDIRTRLEAALAAAPDKSNFSFQEGDVTVQATAMPATDAVPSHT